MAEKLDTLLQRLPWHRPRARRMMMLVHHVHTWLPAWLARQPSPRREKSIEFCAFVVVIVGVVGGRVEVSYRTMQTEQTRRLPYRKEQPTTTIRALTRLHPSSLSHSNSTAMSMMTAAALPGGEPGYSFSTPAHSSASAAPRTHHGGFYPYVDPISACYTMHYPPHIWHPS